MVSWKGKADGRSASQGHDCLSKQHYPNPDSSLGCAVDTLDNPQKKARHPYIPAVSQF